MTTDPSRVSLVAVASRDIGYATAQRLLSTGHRVVVVDRSEINAQDLRRDDDTDRLWTERQDVKAIAGLRDNIKAEWGDVSVLVNNTAISPKNKNWQSSAGLRAVNRIPSYLKIYHRQPEPPHDDYHFHTPRSK